MTMETKKYIGTIGHIDHGKTSLTAAITKVLADADKAKAITMENDLVERHRIALEKISAIRDSIIGAQTVNWSEHIYPLVAALGEAGFEGAGYEISRANLGTLIDNIKIAEARIQALEVELARKTEALQVFRDTANWVEAARGPYKIDDGAEIPIRMKHLRAARSALEEKTDV